MYTIGETFVPGSAQWTEGEAPSQIGWLGHKQSLMCRCEGAKSGVFGLYQAACPAGHLTIGPESPSLSGAATMESLTGQQVQALAYAQEPIAPQGLAAEAQAVTIFLLALSVSITGTRLVIRWWREKFGLPWGSDDHLAVVAIVRVPIPRFPFIL